MELRQFEHSMSEGEDAMSIAIVFQKLETIKIVQTDPNPITHAGGDLRVDTDVGMWRTIYLGLRVGEQMGFAWSDDWLVPFEDHVKLTLHQDNNFGLTKTLGSVTVPSSALDTGERSYHFTDEGAHVVLTYFVKEMPGD
jgi:hypothetical protein